MIGTSFVLISLFRALTHIERRYRAAWGGVEKARGRRMAKNGGKRKQYVAYKFGKNQKIRKISNLKNQIGQHNDFGVQNRPPARLRRENRCKRQNGAGRRRRPVPYGGINPLCPLYVLAGIVLGPVARPHPHRSTARPARAGCRPPA